MQLLPSLETSKYYHIYNRGNNGENIFREERNYTHFLRLYAKYIEPVAETYAYCLLRNHFHVLVRIRETRETCEVSETSQVLNAKQAFSNFFNSYTKSINQAYQRTGSLFQKRFGRIAVTSDQYLYNWCITSISIRKNMALSATFAIILTRPTVRCCLTNQPN